MRKLARWDGKLYTPVRFGDPVQPGGIPMPGTGFLLALIVFANGIVVFFLIEIHGKH